MYKIYCDNTLIFDDENISQDFFLIEPTLELEAGKAGTLTFTIYPNHPAYSSFVHLVSIITVTQNGDYIFRGRVLSSEESLDNSKKVTCEGDLAFLNDSIIRPYDFSLYTYQHKSPRQLLEYFIAEHNSQVELNKQFTVGTVTVSLSVDRYLAPTNKNYESAYNNISNELVKVCDGYLMTRYENGITYIDYLSEFTVNGTQTIEFGKNLSDLVLTKDGEEVATVIVPIGADEEVEQEYIDPSTGEITTQTVHKPITIKGVIDPDTHQTITVDYLVNTTLQAIYGNIYKTVEFSDCTLRIDLYNQAKEYLSKMSAVKNSFDITALDLTKIEQNISSFKLGTNIRVISARHNLDSYIPVQKLSLNLTHPEDSTLTLGEEKSTMTSERINTEYLTQLEIEEKEGEILSNVDAIKLSFNSTTLVAKMEQVSSATTFYLTTSNGRIRVSCIYSSNHPNYKTVNAIPPDGVGFFALHPVSIDNIVVYYPFFARRVVTNDVVTWYDINDTSGITQVTNIMVIGTFNTTEGTTNFWGSAKTIDEANVEAFMEYFSTTKDVSDATLNTFANACGISTIFGKIAITQAFVNKLVANDAFIRSLVVYALRVGSGNDSSGFIMRIIDGNPPTIVAKFNGEELWKIDATTGKMYGNFARVRQYLPFQWEDSLDNSYPMECSFYIPTQAERVSVKLSARNLKFRAYSKAAVGGGAGGYGTIDIAHSGIILNTIPASLSVIISNDGVHGHNVNGSCSCSQGFGSLWGSTDSSGSHSHNASILGDALSNVSISDVGHTHTIDLREHTHDLSFGIHEGTKCNSVNLYIDNGSGYGSAISLGSGDALASGLDLTQYFSGTGWKKIKFTTRQLGRIQAQLIAELLVTT